MKHTQLFTKTTKQAPKDEVSRNAELLIRGGYVDKLAAGVYTLLPLGLRVLQKIEQIIREEMNAVGGQEILMPTLQPRELWEKTGRWNTVDVLFKLIGSGDKEYTLGATHEEVVTPLTQKFVLSYKDLPQAIYQIQTKFRDEPRPKSGLLRGREFRMKDLYSFHRTVADFDAYYERLQAAYTAVYARAGIGDATVMTYASGGAFSKYSHEYQTLTPAGEDTIYLCTACRVAVNREILGDLNNQCPRCQSRDLKEEKAIEVGNIFSLGTRFSEAFGFHYADEAGQVQPIPMGCFGIGSTRLMGTIVEVLNDERGIVWPVAVAPFQVHLLSLASTEEEWGKVEVIYQALLKAKIEVLYDDRRDVRAGEKFADSDLLGIPLRLVVSAKTLAEEKVEVKRRTEDTVSLIAASDAVAAVRQFLPPA